MKQITVNGFADLLVNSRQFKELSKTEEKLLLLDKCNWVISTIYRGVIKEKDKEYLQQFININSRMWNWIKTKFKNLIKKLTS